MLHRPCGSQGKGSVNPSGRETVKKKERGPLNWGNRTGKDVAFNPRERNTSNRDREDRSGGCEKEGEFNNANGVDPEKTGETEGETPVPQLGIFKSRLERGKGGSGRPQITMELSSKQQRPSLEGTHARKSSLRLISLEKISLQFAKNKRTKKGKGTPFARVAKATKERKTAQHWLLSTTEKKVMANENSPRPKDGRC